jgi:tetratricopeptide (TPR) repeat protein
LAKEEKTGNSIDIRAVQEEIAFLRQTCNSLMIRGHYAECIKTIEENLALFYTGERWPEHFFSILRMYQKCYPSLDKSQDLSDYLTPILKKNNIPFVFALLLKQTDASIEWKADVFRDRAVVCQNEGKFEEAVGYIDIVLKIDPRSGSARVMRGWFLAELGRDKEALEMYEEALELNPGNKHALNSVAKHYRKADPKKALEYIDSAIQDSPDEASYYASKAEILTAMGDREDALAAIDKALSYDPYNPEFPYQKAELLLADGKEGGALPQYRLALALNERHVPSLLRLIELTKEHQPELALGYVNTVLLMQPENRGLMQTRAELYERLGGHDDAIKQYKALLVLEPDHVEALGNLGEIYLTTGEPERAAEVLGRAVELAPKNARYHYDMGKAMQRLDRNDDAAKEYRAATNEDKRYYQAWAGLGFLSAETNPTEAADHFGKALKLAPENAYYHAALAEVQLRLPGETSAAIDSFVLACKYDPGNGELHYKLGCLLEEMGNDASAVVHFKEAISLDPRGADAFYRLAHLQFDTHPELALLYINSAISLDLVNGLYLFFKGQVLASLDQNPQAMKELETFFTAGEGDRSESDDELAELIAGGSLRLALHYLTRATELEPGNPAFLCARAHLLYRMGQTPRAREQYEKILKENSNQHEALFGMARILAGDNNKKALDYFDSAIKVEPGIAVYHAEKAAFLAQDDAKYPEALEEYTLAIELGKHMWRVILEKAKLLDAHGDVPAALEEYRHVLMVYRKSIDAAARLGELLADVAPGHATVYLDQAIKLDPENYKNYAWRGKVQFLLGNEDAAADSLNAAILHGGETAEVYSTLAAVLEQNQPELALEYAKKALAFTPNDANLLALCGNLYLGFQDYPLAKECYEKAAALNKDDHTLWEHLAEIAFLTDDPDMNEVASEAHKSKPDCLACTYLKARILDEKEGDAASALSFMTRVVDLAPDVLEYHEKLVELLTAKRALIRLPIERFRLEKLRKKLAEPMVVPPPPEFEEEEEPAAEATKDRSPGKNTRPAEPDTLFTKEGRG